MSKIAVVYWSGSGNTEAMALALEQGAKGQGGIVDVFRANEFDSSMMDAYDGIAFGCPSMGCEVLEESEFAPMFEECLAKLSNKKIVLFGSYGWGDGEWMRNWETTCLQSNAILVSDYVICNQAPSLADLDDCRNLGASLV